MKSCGCQPVHSEIVKDDFEILKNKIIEFKDADIIITSGGTSAGAGDVLRLVLDEMGEVLVHGIAVKPGKPTIVGLIKNDNEDQIIFGLPGYPVAALMVFYVFIAPFLKKISSFKGNEGNNTIKNSELSRRF